MSSRWISCFLCFIFVCFFSEANAWDASPKCYRKLGTTFFEQGALFQALSLYRVPQSTWSPLFFELSRKTKDLHREIWKRARKLDPNPLQERFQLDPAAELLQQALMEVFTSALKNYMFINPGDTRAMFQFIEGRQGEKIEKCFGRPTLLPEQRSES